MQTRLRSAATLALAFAIVLSPAASTRPAPAVEASSVSLRGTRALMQRVADWQLAHMQRFDYVHPVGRTPEPRGWVQGVFWLGLATWADQTHSDHYAAAVWRLGEAQDWRLGDRLYVADDHLIGQSYLRAFDRTHDARAIMPLRGAFDQILAHPPAVSLDYGPRDGAGALTCLPRWCWADAVFMAPATWAGMSRATGDPRYLAYAKAEVAATTQLLFDRQDHLFYRDSRFITRRGQGGAKIFWSRGNGWVLAGLANMLKAMPADDPGRATIAATFTAMAERIAGLQRADGSWPSSLLEPGQPATAETSGAALFVYALAWGVHAGILDRAAFDAQIRRGWHRLTQAVSADGRVGWVQQIGDAPQAPGPDDTQLYGSGAMLLAGAAMLELDRVKPDRP